MIETAFARRPRWTTWLFVGLPIWLVVSAAVAVWWQMKKGPDSDATPPDRRFVLHVSEKLVREDLHKLRDLIGERNLSTPATAKNLKRAASWIAGSLGPSNTGYNVRLVPGPSDVALIHVTLQGKSATPGIWCVTAYDSARGTAVEADGSGVCAVLAAARGIAGDQPKRPIHFLFVPHANDPASPREATGKACLDLIRSAGSATRVLAVRGMATGSSLLLTAPVRQDLPADSITFELATPEISPPGADDPAAWFPHSGFPVNSLTTGTPATDAADPSAAALARSASTLLEFLRRLANH
ncbi:MAG: hypothetical protein V4733_06545 [Verrucomicrobiota bacterium]